MREMASSFPKPAYYAGIEDGVILKNPSDLTLRIALAFPDTYEVGMSYLGQKILYHIVNSKEAWWAERVMCPEWEVCKIIRDQSIPLATLESDTPLKSLDAVCFSVTHELCFTDILHMLDLAQIPLRTSQRSENINKCPIIMAGGGAMLGAEALAPFIDLVALGDGEELFPEILTLLEQAKKEGWKRNDFLTRASTIPGVYIPSLFIPDENGRLAPVMKDYRPARRIVADLDKAPYPVRQITPIGAVHNRLALEIARGCTRGCRFCHAGIVYRPPRERKLSKLADILEECLNTTGFEEVSFLSLSAGDYSALKSLYNQSYERCAAEQISLSLPSLRVGSVGREILARMASLRRTGMTLAPEAGTQRLRDVINKGISEEELMDHVRLLGEEGWQHLKLYFMIGLPTETDEDLRGIFDLCKKAQLIGSHDKHRMRITAAVSTFVPKPFTPFQWEEQIGLEEINRRIYFLRDLFKTHKYLQLRWHDPRASHLEGILSRSDRRMADVVEKAYGKGAIFCSWHEFFNLDLWLDALRECNLDAQDYISAKRTDAILPWDHLECGVSPSYLLKERDRAYNASITPDCRYGLCGNCGVCDRNNLSSRLPKTTPDEKHKCRLVFSQRDQAQSLKGDFPPISPVLSPRIGVDNTRPRFQYRIWHKKLGHFSLVSQLELQGIIEKAIRKARLPLAFSNGFHPMPRVSFGRALPVGVESLAEWFAITLTEKRSLEDIKACLNHYLQLPLQIFTVETTDSKKRTEQAIKESFLLTFPDEKNFKHKMKFFQNFIENEEFLYTRMTKKGERTTDLRPFLEQWQIYEKDASLRFLLDWRQGYISPLLFVQAILNDMDKTRFDIKICKLAQIYETERIYGME